MANRADQSPWRGAANAWAPSIRLQHSTFLYEGALAHAHL